jgi:hypothetical protein
MLKKVTILFLILLLIIPTFSGCFKKKIEDKIAEEITEGILEKVTGNEADIDIDDGSISMKGEDGSEVILGSTEWPKGKAIDLIPEFKHGTISYTMNSDTVCAINIEDVEQKDFENYVEEIKSLGYTKDSLDMDTEMFIGYYANSEKDNSKITLRYIMEQKEAMISISLEE